MEEKQLIEGCLRGESRAQKGLYELYAPAMLSVCMRYVCNKEVARDLMHDGFIKLFTKIYTYSEIGSFKSWMRKIFATTALEYLRKNDVLKHSVELDVENYQSDEDECQYMKDDISYFEHIESNDLLEIIANLPVGYRTVFNMYVIEGYAHAEIAKELKISESTSRSQFLKARKLLQKIIEDKYI